MDTGDRDVGCCSCLITFALLLIMAIIIAEFMKG